MSDLVLLPFLYLFIILISVPIIYRQREIRHAYYVFNHLRSLYNLEEVTEGSLTDYIKKLRTDSAIPPVCLYLFSEREDRPISFLAFHPLSLMRLPSTYHPFGLPAKVANHKFPIFIPKKWQMELAEEDLKWIICHEIGHFLDRWKDNYLNIFYPFLRPQYFCSDQYFLDREARADVFAAKLTSLEQSVAALRKIGMFATDFTHPLGFNTEIFTRITMLKNRFS